MASCTLLVHLELLPGRITILISLGFAAVASLSKCINCQYQLRTVGFVSGASPAMPPQPRSAGHCQRWLSLLPAAKAAPQKCWICTGAGNCWEHREQIHIHHPTGTARRDGLIVFLLYAVLPMVFNWRQHHVKVFYKTFQPTSIMWV